MLPALIRRVAAAYRRLTDSPDDAGFAPPLRSWRRRRAERRCAEKSPTPPQPSPPPGAERELIRRASREARERALHRHFLPLPARAALQLHRAIRRPARTDHDLPGMTHQVGVGELHPGPLLAVVIERLAAERAVELFRDAVARGVAALEVEDRGPERGNGIGPDDAGLVMARLDHRADEARDADPVAAHLRMDRAPVGGRDREAHRFRIFGAEVENMPDLDSPSLAPPRGCHLLPSG